MFNAANTIGGTIGSVQAQTYQNWEMLVIDDCSTDDSRQVVREFIRNDRRIRLIESDCNFGGPARPRNIGMMNSSGKYLAFLDSDDLWLKDKLEKQVDFLEQNREYFLVYSKCFIKKNGRVIGQAPRRMYSGNVFNQLYLEFNFIDCCTVMMANRKTAPLYTFSEEKRLLFTEDYVMWLNIAQDNKIGSINEPLAVYVLHENNCSPNKLGAFRLVKSVMDDFAPRVPTAVRIIKYFLYYYKLCEFRLMQLLKKTLNK
jgi:teichuronic acid biosynthesis glycosyltransferase TuaG